MASTRTQPALQSLFQGEGRRGGQLRVSVSKDGQQRLLQGGCRSVVGHWPPPLSLRSSRCKAQNAPGVTTLLDRTAQALPHQPASLSQLAPHMGSSPAPSPPCGCRRLKSGWSALQASWGTLAAGCRRSSGSWRQHAGERSVCLWGRRGAPGPKGEQQVPSMHVGAGRLHGVHAPPRVM